DSLQRVGDGGIVSGGYGEGLPRQPPAGLAGEAAGVRSQLFGDGGVVGDRCDDGHILKVFGGGAHHGRAADVDVLNDLGEGRAGLGGGLLKGVEVDHNHVDGLDAVLL